MRIKICGNRALKSRARIGQLCCGRYAMTVQLSSKQQELHDQAVGFCKSHVSLEYARVENLIEIEAHGVHKAFGKKMFVYATDVLEMDPGLAYPYIAVARACVKFKELRNALNQRKLTVSKAAR